MYISIYIYKCISIVLSLAALIVPKFSTTCSKPFTKPLSVDQAAEACVMRCRIPEPTVILPLGAAAMKCLLIDDLRSLVSKFIHCTAFLLYVNCCCVCCLR